jgi:hypothetical protein
MENTSLNKAYLETLSTTGLMALADENGIDIPEGLNRRFIIGELLELADDNRQDDTEPSLIINSDMVEYSAVLPETYNETQVTILLRDPGWVFVYWDFHSTLFSAVYGNHRFETFFLRVNSLSNENPAAITDFFDVEVGIHDRKWYVHLSNRDYACRIDLYARNSQEKEKLLAKSAEMHIPSLGDGDSLNTLQRRNPPLLELSGIADLRKIHFKNHRQSFS